MIKEIEYEKDLRFIKIIANIVIYSFVILFIVFTFAVDKVFAQTQTGIYLQSDYSLCSISNTGDKSRCITGVGHPGGVSSFATNINQIGFFVTTNDYTLQANTSYTIEYEYRLTLEKDSSTATIPNPTGMLYSVKNGYRNSTNTLVCSDASWSRIASAMGNGVYNAIFHLDCTLNVGNSAITRFSIINTIASSSTGALFVTMTPLKLGITKNASSQNQQDVINNQNQNTQNIIINNNSNTNKIVDSTNKNTKAVEDVNDTLNDSSVDNPESALNGIKNYFGSNGVISDLLLLPVTLYSAIINNINGTCTNFTLGTLFGHTLILPCINLSSWLGQALYGTIDLMFSGFFIMKIRKKFVDIFNHFTSLEVGGNELE